MVVMNRNNLQPFQSARLHVALPAWLVGIFLPIAASAMQLTFHETALGPGSAFPEQLARKQPTYFEPTVSCCENESDESSYLQVCSNADGGTLAARLVKSRQAGKNRQSTYEVSVRDRPIFRFKIAAEGMQSAIERLCWLGSDWLVAYPGHVVVNGEDIAQKHGYQSVFYYRRMDDKTLFFFRRGGRVGLSYGGEEQARQYEKVLYHPDQDLARYDIHNNDRRVWFYGTRDGRWYFVDATVGK